MTAPVWNDGARIARPSDSLPAADHVNAVVVGAGLTGLCTALRLAEAGRKVVVAEARSVGACASGASTGKVTVLQGNRLSLLAESFSIDVAQDYLRAHQHGVEEILRLCSARQVPFERANAFTYAGTPEGVNKVRNEFEVCRELGLPVSSHDSLDTAFPVHAAVELPDQVQLDPVALLDGLVAAVVAAGGRVVEGCRVTGLEESDDRVAVETTAGRLSADHVILATASPILDHVLTTTELVPHRSYLCAFDLAGSAPESSAPEDALPEGMFVSVDSPSRTLRKATVNAQRVLLVGGNGHRTGEAISTQELIGDLESWTVEHFPNARMTHAWSAQDHHPTGMVPLVTTFGSDEGRVHFAGGYSKWGITGAPAAARIISDRILGRPETVSFGTPSKLGAMKNAVKSQAKTPAMMVGNLVREGLKPTAETTVGGETVEVSLVCPHAGGICTWNDAESSWDCPLHGSRFDADGSVLEGPATTDLKRL